MTYPCGNDEYCGDKICHCGAKETKERLAANTVGSQMEYFQKRWGYLPEIEKATVMIGVDEFGTFDEEAWNNLFR